MRGSTPGSSPASRPTPAGRGHRRAGPTLAVGAVAVGAVAALAAAAGCGGPGGHPASGAGSRAAAARQQQSSRAPLPAFEAGGACQLLDFDVIRQTIGVSFAVAAAAQQGPTFTCVVQPSGAGFPDLALSVSSTGADEKAFQGAVVPSGAAAVAGLGKTGYSVVIAADATAGPGVEVGWLSGGGRLMVLRYRALPATAPETVAAIGPKLVELAKLIDFSSA